MACLLGHKWDGCTCSKCGKTRNEGHKWEGARCALCGGVQLSGVLTDSEISDVVKCLDAMKTDLGKMAKQGDAFYAERVNAVNNLLAIVENGNVVVDKYIWAALCKTLEDGQLFGYFTGAQVDNELIDKIIKKLQNA